MLKPFIMARSSEIPSTNRSLSLKLLSLLQVLRMYHRHEIVGAENIPTDGPGLMTVNHSLATYDITLLAAAVYESTGRIPKALVDRLFFKIPYLGELVHLIGCVEGAQNIATKLLQSGYLVYVAPGGMKEAIRPSSKKFEVMWESRRGFTRLAYLAQSPIILSACARADELYDVYENPLSKTIYETFKIPFFIARGLGPTIIPKPIKLTHVIGKPLQPPKLTGEEKNMTKDEMDERLNSFHEKVISQMKKLMKQSLKY